MDPEQFFTTPAVTIVAGKGGVGKTTAVATMALAAAKSGLNPLIVEVEGKSGLPALFGKSTLTYDEIELLDDDPDAKMGKIRARALTPDAALVEYLGDNGLQRISKRLRDTGALDLVATATPGIKDVLILGKIKQLELAGEADLIIVDAPAAGHAISFLRSASGLLDAVNAGPIQAQAREVTQMLTNGDRCQVVLVTLPEETPVNELIETAFSLEDQVEVALGPVIVNGVYAPLDHLDADPVTAAKAAGVSLRAGEADALAAAAAFRTSRAELQQRQLERLSTELPLDQLRLPFIFESDLELDELSTMADALLEQIELLSDRPVTAS